MYLFFVEASAIEGTRALVRGSDYNHMKNVLRMKRGEKLRISDGSSVLYDCELEGYEEGSDPFAVLTILSRDETGTELPAQIVLYQGLPKGDKLELIIQKNVELGVSAIVPVAAKRSVMKVDPKKEESKLRRWNAISESAAKQSKRTIIPEVRGVLSFKQMLSETEGFDLKLMPYENAEGIAYTREILNSLRGGMRIAVFIGPEGGIDDSEIGAALSAGFKPVTLGKRILRTETAGFTLMAAMMLQLENQ